MKIALKQIVVPPGSQILIEDISWSIYEQILADLGDDRSTRANYARGVLEILNPLPEHEDDKVMLGDFIKVILEELDLEFRSLGSTTFKRQDMDAGVEADDCFYIANEPKIRGKKRIDLETDPPPDLAIEIDITSRTTLKNYLVLGVKEVWKFNGETLSIYRLEGGEYIRSNMSFWFPGLSLTQMIPEYLERSRIEGRNTTMKQFRGWVRQQIESNR
ncbi:MAG: Uma2 family endonuclease [Cyanobacteriota bacterium]|nr:Uma2 family endonuclease [Cyanobacteriota bacterium]